MRKENGGSLSSVVFGAMIGAGGSMIITLLLAALGASLVSRGTISESAMDGVVAGVLSLSATVGSLMAVVVTGHHRLVVGVVSGAMYFLVLLGCSAMLFDGAFQGVGVTALVILGGGLGGVLLSVNANRRSPGKKRLKSRYRKVVQN